MGLWSDRIEFSQRINQIRFIKKGKTETKYTDWDRDRQN